MKLSLLLFLLFLTFSNFSTAGNQYSIYSPKGKSYTFKGSEFSRTKNGFFSLTEVNIAFGLSSIKVPYSERFFGATSVAGYQFKSKLFTGIGAGILDYNQGVLAPVFLHGRYYFTKKKHKPFATADAGMFFRISGTETNNRIYANPGIGIIISTSKSVTFTGTVSLFSQWEKDIQRDSFLNFKIGVLFF